MVLCAVFRARHFILDIMSTSESRQSFKTTSEILACIHECYVEKQQEKDPYLSSVDWDCVLEPGIYREERDAELNEWTNAAYKGNWDALFRIAVRYEQDMGRFANSSRLHPRFDATSGNPFVGKLSGYTALHQAAWHGAPVEIVQGLIELGASRGIRTTDGKRQRPLDIANEKNHEHLYDILTPRGLPEVSDEELLKVEAHFHEVVVAEARGVFKSDSMRLPDLGLLRDHPRVWMPIPGMYGGFNFWWDDGHLVTESSCRVCGGSGRTNHITSGGAKLVDQGWD